jgi:hypothetical protein
MPDGIGRVALGGTKKDSPDDQHHFLDTKQFAGVEGNTESSKRAEP